jgi:hypothetical protein
MADPILLGRLELSHRPVPAHGHEDRVVAEATGTAGFRGKGSLAKTLDRDELLARRQERGHAPVAGRETGDRDPSDRADQLGEVPFVGRVRTGEPGAPRARPSSECIDLDPRVIRQGRDRQGIGDGSSLEARVVEVGLPRLVDIREGARVTVVNGDPLHWPIRADPDDLDELVLVLRRERDPSRKRHPGFRYPAPQPGSS